MALKVLGARILVLRDEKELEKNGIILPDQSVERPRSGVVVEVGPGTRLENGRVIPVEVFIGDRIIYADLQGAPIVDPITYREYYLINERDVLGIIRSASDAPKTVEEAMEKIEAARDLLNNLHESLAAAGVEGEDLKMLTGKRGILDELREEAANVFAAKEVAKV